MMSVEQVLGPSEEGDARVGNASENGNNGSGGLIQVHEGLPIPPQQPQNSLVRWERFLPIRSLKVLLVENDDCTRQVVSALLRNCSYEVTTAANGLQAWKILENMDNHIDLVLTEVAMPVVSGIGLLSKITTHKSLRNVPVIMMSSHDSMGIVFKCLSKGAVDFLVKPIRKNELKNLWQHVWRRCHSSSGSGSESGTQPRISTKSKSADKSGNNSDSSNELYDNGSNGLTVCDGSDNGSGTQSSWTKRAAVDSPRQFSHSYQLADAPDSTCAQVIHTKPETSVDKRVRAVDTKQQLTKDEKHDDAALGKNPDVGKFGNPDEQCDCRHESLSSDPSSTRENILSDKANNPVENGHHEHTSDNIVTIGKDQGPKPCSRNTNCINLQIKKLNVSNGQATPLAKDKPCCDSGDSPSLELSLKSMRGFDDGCSAVNDERNVLRHSDLSAFSKYKTTSSANQGPTGNVGSCSPLENSSVAMKTETGNYIAFPLSGTLLNQQSNGSSNNDIASTAKNITPKPEAVNDKAESSSAFKSLNSSAFQPALNGRVSSPKQVVPAKTEDVGVNTPPKAPCRGSTQKVQVQHHHHHHHHHYHHHHHNKQQNEAELEDDHVPLKDVAAASGQCGSSNITEGLTEGTAGNYSMNGSGSRSNHGSNEPNGSSIGLNTALTNTESDNKACADAGAGGTGPKLSGNAAEEDRAAQREAALSKFRQKRKERCFEKKGCSHFQKYQRLSRPPITELREVCRSGRELNSLPEQVRYQSRKRLAEQRPRVKGQFVRQSTSDNKLGKDVTNNDHSSEDNSCDSLR